tara:strand:+ start:10580 stop:10801 length:222 start_codon:yes stop_codon:yes gene_type:complete
MMILGVHIEVLHWSVDSKKDIKTQTVKGKKGTIKEIISSEDVIKVTGFIGEDQSKVVNIQITAPSGELDVTTL